MQLIALFLIRDIDYNKKMMYNILYIAEEIMKLIAKINNAIESQDVEFLKKLVAKKKIDLNMPINEDEDTLPIWAIQNNIWELIKPVLLDDKLDINKTNADNVNAIYAMVVNAIESKLPIEEKQRYSNLIQNILYRKNINVNNVVDGSLNDEYLTRTPWQFVYDARKTKSEEENAIIEELVQAFAKKENLVDEFGVNELMYACQIGDEDLVDKILKYGYYDINAQDEDGETALHHAIMGGNENIVNKLLRINGIDLTIKNKLGQDAFLEALACCENEEDEAHYNIAKRISKTKDFNLNIQDLSGQSAFIYAYKLEDLSIFNDLISRKGINFDVLNKDLEKLLSSIIEAGDVQSFDKVVSLEGVDKDIVEITVRKGLVKLVAKEDMKTFDHIMANKDLNLNIENVNEDNYILDAMLGKNSHAVDKILERKEFEVNSPIAYGYMDSMLFVQDLENIHKLIRHKSFAPNILDENGANVFGHLFSEDNIEKFEPDALGSVFSFVMDECNINNIEELLNHVDNNGNDTLMNAIVNHIEASSLEVFFANIKKHFGYVEIDVTKKNNEGKTLVDLIKEVSSHKEEVEKNRLVKIFKDYKNANVVKNAKTNEAEVTIELEPIYDEKDIEE